MITISVMVPSRGRPQSLQDALLSLHNTAAHPENIEYIVRVDDNDKTLQDYKNIQNIKLISGPRGRGYADMGIFFDDMAQAANGKWLMIWGDDAIMINSDWDDIFYQKENSIIYGREWLFFAVPHKVLNKCKTFSPTAHPDTWWMQVGLLKLPQFCVAANWTFTHDRHDDQTIKDRDAILMASSSSHFLYASEENLTNYANNVLKIFQP